ncbi:hypothetical protein IscW_ISCW018367 [Ixodes scapularis]|uniref:Uncharacterized protein n=1 Tax=Ixodes scapularis TaxID=6945 RepID=B7PK41_IXOSC|nr:hypothetical protein IscW_ISCW018367 [Ixodes scapularis]|eukprot:XP_002409279.1 hypothetical protein IscW_ISCW018367 [Ixodes scapularis]
MRRRGTHHIHVVRPSLGREALGPRRLRGRTPPVSLLGSHGSAGGHGVSSCNVASPASVPHGTLHGTPPPGSHNHGSSHRRRSVTDIPRGGGGGAAPTLRRPRPRTSDVSRSARPAAAARGGRVRDSGVTLPRALLAQSRRQDEEKAGKTVGAHWRRSGELREKRFGMRRMRMETRGSPKSARRIFSERTRLGM